MTPADLDLAIMAILNEEGGVAVLEKALRSERGAMQPYLITSCIRLAAVQAKRTGRAVQIWWQDNRFSPEVREVLGEIHLELRSTHEAPTDQGQTASEMLEARQRHLAALDATNLFRKALSKIIIFGD